MPACRSLLAILFLWLQPCATHAQTDTEFWFVAPEVSKGASFVSYDHPVLFRFSTYSAPATVTVSQPANPAFLPQTVFIPAGSSGEVQIPLLSLLADVENRPPNQVLNKGILIQSTSPITAYYEVLGAPSDNPEIFALKGKNALGTDFFVPFQNILTNSNDYSPSPHAAFDIVATADNTLVTITPTRAIVGHAANVPFSITLQRGQTWSAEAEGQSGPAHPAGSRVVSDKPVAITVKDDLLDGAPVFGGFCDDLAGDQIVPVEKTGTQYVVQKGFLNGDERAFVLATAANTQVSLDGVAQGTLNAGQTLELPVAAGSHFIQTSAPVYLYQMTGVHCEVSGVILPALDCTGSSAVRFVRSTGEDFSLFLVTKSGQEDGFLLNGSPNWISGLSFQTVPGSNGEYVAAVLPLSNAAVPAGQSSVVENTLGAFQMGFLNGGTASGCRFGYFSDFGKRSAFTQTLDFCPGSSITLNGVTYTQPTTVTDTLSGVQGCDTVVIYMLRHAPLDLIFHIDNLRCTGGRINLDYTLCNLGSAALPQQVSVAFYLGNPLTGPAQYLGSFAPLIAGADSCFSGVLFDLGGALQYDGSGSLYAVVNTDGSLPTPFSTGDLPPTGIAECNYDNNLDSTAMQLPDPPLLDLGPDVVLCKDSTVVFDAGPGYAKYLWQDGTVGATLAASLPGDYWVEVADSCGRVQRDSVLLTVSLLPDTQFPDAALCPGDSLALSAPGFDQYDWSPAAGLSCTGCPAVNIRPAVTTTYTLLASTVEGCELRDTFTVEVLSLPARAETIAFCSGQSVIIGGVTYTQPGTVSDTIPGLVGCDTVVTYTLVYTTAPNASVVIDCPADVNIATQAGTGSVAVQYDLPVATSDCPCPGIALVLTEGMPPGSLFPVAKTRVCYETRDSCGNADTCCFFVIVREALPCDVKEIGCMKYELLRITQNAKLERSYRIRVTNKCANPLTYTAIELPDGVTAVQPAHLSVYTTQQPGNRAYEVRNPNYSPFYSIRFKSVTDSIANGESDVFEYTLPQQSAPDYIHITARLEPQVFYEAYLNTFYCPVLPENKPAPGHQRPAGLNVFPNPTSGVLFADLSAWAGQFLQMQVLDARGQRVLYRSLTADSAAQEIVLPQALADGLYFMEMQGPGGARETARFVLVR